MPISESSFVYPLVEGRMPVFLAAYQCVNGAQQSTATPVRPPYVGWFAKYDQ